MDTPRGTVSTGVGVELPCCCRGPGVGVWPAALSAGWLFRFPVLRFVGQECYAPGFLVSLPSGQAFSFCGDGFPFCGQVFPFLSASFLPCMSMVGCQWGRLSSSALWSQGLP